MPREWSTVDRDWRHGRRRSFVPSPLQVRSPRLKLSTINVAPARIQKFTDPGHRTFPTSKANFGSGQCAFRQVQRMASAWDWNISNRSVPSPRFTWLGLDFEVAWGWEDTSPPSFPKHHTPPRPKSPITLPPHTISTLTVAVICTPSMMLSQQTQPQWLSQLVSSTRLDDDPQKPYSVLTWPALALMPRSTREKFNSLTISVCPHECYTDSSF